MEGHRPSAGWEARLHGWMEWPNSWRGFIEAGAAMTVAVAVSSAAGLMPVVAVVWLAAFVASVVVARRSRRHRFAAVAFGATQLAVAVYFVLLAVVLGSID